MFTEERSCQIFFVLFKDIMYIESAQFLLVLFSHFLRVCKCTKNAVFIGSRSSIHDNDYYIHIGSKQKQDFFHRVRDVHANIVVDCTYFMQPLDTLTHVKWCEVPADMFIGQFFNIFISFMRNATLIHFHLFGFLSISKKIAKCTHTESIPFISRSYVYSGRLVF